MKKRGISYLRQRSHFIIFFLSTTLGVICILATVNSYGLDILLQYLYRGVSGPHHYTAYYSEFLLRANSEEFFEFHSGYGRNSIATVRLQFPDGSVYELDSIPCDSVEKIYPGETVSTHPGTTSKTTRYSSGFNIFKFRDGKLEGVSLTKTSNIKIDFGDGNFLELPIDRERLLKLLGDPDEWQASRTSLP